jgi:hypothetical protein
MTLFHVFSSLFAICIRKTLILDGFNGWDSAADAAFYICRIMPIIGIPPFFAEDLFSLFPALY